MPLAHLIFFEEPRELSDAEYEEARDLGHLRPPAAPPSAGVSYPVTQVAEQDIAVTSPPGLPDVQDEPDPGGGLPAAKTKTRRKES